MSLYFTYAQIKTKVESDLDLEDQTFIPDDEMLGYANEAVGEAEAEVHGIYEDYFLTRAFLPLVAGTEAYNLPTNIYANKIRGIMYRNAGDYYTIKRIMEWHKFAEYTEELAYQTSTWYQYLLINTTPGVPQILLSPPAKETSSQNVTIWYIRSANRFTTGTDICDIPQFVEFVIQYMKVRCLEKEGNPGVVKAMADLEQQRGQMTSTLQTMVPDNENNIQPDLSIYRDHS